MKTFYMAGSVVTTICHELQFMKANGKWLNL